MERQGLNQRLKRVNRESKPTLMKKGLYSPRRDRWVVGGVACESTYLHSRPRVLWILKEARKEARKKDEVDSLPEFVRRLLKQEEFERGKGHPYYRIGRLTWLLTEGVDATDMEEVKKGLRCCAVINLKKTRGESSATESEIGKWAECCPELWRQEIGILAPDVIVAGGTCHHITRHARLCKKTNLCKRADRYCMRVELDRIAVGSDFPGREVCLLDCYHPKARKEWKTMLPDARRWREDCAEVWCGK